MNGFSATEEEDGFFGTVLDDEVSNFKINASTTTLGLDHEMKIIYFYFHFVYFQYRITYLS